MTTITDPGIYAGIDEKAYHADRESFSHSWAKVILDCPARLRWALEHREEKDAYDLGTIAHRLILSSDDHRIRVADAYDWKQWQKWNPWKDAVRAEGNVAVNRAQLLAASKMAAAVRRHTVASEILGRPGRTEVSVYGRDLRSNVTLRARYDRLTVDDDGAPLIVDVKTTSTRGPDEFARKAFRFGYHTGAAWYSDLAVIAGLTKEPPRFLILAVETEAPHFVHLHEFDSLALDIARAANRQAIDTYASCRSADHWPAYPEDVNLMPPPAWLYDDDMEID